jgi:transcriptional regulator with XRE-family HTH domain
MGLSKNIAYRLRTTREAAGLSQEQVAERADLRVSQVAKMEQGRKADPRASTILALASALGVRPGQLLEDLTPPPEGFFPPKDKKGKKKSKKKKKKQLAAMLAGAANTDGAATGGETLSVTSPEATANGHTNGAEPKKKRKK